MIHISIFHYLQIMDDINGSSSATGCTNDYKNDEITTSTLTTERCVIQTTNVNLEEEFSLRIPITNEEFCNFLQIIENKHGHYVYDRHLYNIMSTTMLNGQRPGQQLPPQSNIRLLVSNGEEVVLDKDVTEMTVRKTLKSQRHRDAASYGDTNTTAILRYDIKILKQKCLYAISLPEEYKLNDMLEINYKLSHEYDIQLKDFIQLQNHELINANSRVMHIERYEYLKEKTTSCIDDDSNKTLFLYRISVDCFNNVTTKTTHYYLHFELEMYSNGGGDDADCSSRRRILAERFAIMCYRFSSRINLLTSLTKFNRKNEYLYMEDVLCNIRRHCLLRSFKEYSLNQWETERNAAADSSKKKILIHNNLLVVQDKRL